MNKKFYQKAWRSFLTWNVRRYSQKLFLKIKEILTFDLEIFLFRNFHPSDFRKISGKYAEIFGVLEIFWKILRSQFFPDYYRDIPKINYPRIGIFLPTKIQPCIQTALYTKIFLQNSTLVKKYVLRLNKAIENFGHFPKHKI